MSSEQYLTPKEAAALLGISVGTLSNWRTSGSQSLPYYKTGRVVRYKPADIAKWMEYRRRV